MIPHTLVTTYLEMCSYDTFKPAYAQTDATILRMAQPDLPFYRFLYREVGYQWRWYDRLKLSDADLHAALTAPGVVIDVLYADGVPAGYIEQAMQSDGDTEIVYFGLRTVFIGRGLGKHLLSCGVQRAWDDGASRLWLHTCNLDSPHALANYRARGFVVYRVKREPMPAHYRD